MLEKLFNLEAFDEAKSLLTVEPFHFTLFPLTIEDAGMLFLFLILFVLASTKLLSTRPNTKHVAGHD